MKCPKCGEDTIQKVENCFGDMIFHCGKVCCGYRKPTWQESKKKYYKSTKAVYPYTELTKEKGWKAIWWK